jgi:multidrug resistance efflux pump
MKQFLVVVILVVLVGVGARIALQGDAVPRPADAAAVATADLVSANGTVEGARPEVTLRPEVAGTLKAINARENDCVSQGMVVAELANETQKAQVALARVELAIARQQLRKLQAGERAQVRVRAKADVAAREETYRNAREEMARLSAARGGVSASDLDAARTRVASAKADLDKAKAGLALIEEGSRAEDVEAAEAQVQAAEAKLQVAEAELAKTRLIAPTNARVLQVFAEPGKLASPTTAQPILILADLSKRRVRAFVEELDVDRIEVGRTATVTVDGLPGRTFTADFRRA